MESGSLPEDVEKVIGGESIGADAGVEDTCAGVRIPSEECGYFVSCELKCIAAGEIGRRSGR